VLGEELSQQTPVKTLNKTNTCMSKKSTFKFEALNEAGKPIKGTIDAANSDEAVARIRSQGFFPTSIRPEKKKKINKSVKSRLPSSLQRDLDAVYGDVDSIFEPPLPQG